MTLLQIQIDEKSVFQIVFCLPESFSNITAQIFIADNNIKEDTSMSEKDNSAARLAELGRELQ